MIDPTLKELTEAMIEILDVQDRLNTIKARIAEEKGVGNWTFDYGGETWILRINKKYQSSRNGQVVRSEVSLTRAKKL